MEEAIKREKVAAEAKRKAEEKAAEREAQLLKEANEAK